MKYILLLHFFIAILIVSSCKGQVKENKPLAPVSDLAHIDLILDSATWAAVKADSFVQKDFGVINLDTTHYGGKPSYDIYLLGQLNFLHLSQAKGFWNNQKGSGVLVFQSQKPGMKDSLLYSWKQLYKDSLFIHSYKGSDFTLDEVMAWYKKDSTKPKEPALFANLTTYSADAYKNWGITDSIVNAGLALKQLMGSWGGKELEEKLFHSITELHMFLNQKEFTEIKSALLATGYTEENKTFIHPTNPYLFITVSEEKGKSKYSKVKFKLTKPVAAKEIFFSPSLTLKLNGTEAWLLIN